MLPPLSDPDTARGRALAMAFDLPSHGCALCDGLKVRPFSLNFFRRSSMLCLDVVIYGPGLARKWLPPEEVAMQLETAQFLASQPLELVRAAMMNGDPCRRGLIDQMVEELERRGGLAAMRGEFALWLSRMVRLTRAAQYGTELRESALEIIDKQEEAPPTALLNPAGMASTVTLLARECPRWSEDFLLEWLPLPRALAYLHAIHARDPHLWTVDPEKQSAPILEPDLPPDPGSGEAVEF